MPVINRIAHFQNRRDELPNQELARDLAARHDTAGVREIASNLWHKDKNVRADCIKVLYEIGYIDAHLISDYAEEFLKLLKSANNRLVWGAMIALGTIAALRAEMLFQHLPDIRKAMEEGSVITMDHGVLTLALVAAAHETYNHAIFPYLLDHLRTCRPKELPQHSERTLPAVNAANKADFSTVLEKRMGDLSGSGLQRARRVLKEAGKR